MNAEQIETATKTVCEGILEGLPARFACINALISQKTYLVWRMRGEKTLEGLNDGEDVSSSMYQAYMEFFVRTERAHGEYVQSLKKRMLNNSPDNVAAMSWLLERRYPEEYGEGENLYFPKKNGEDEDENSAIVPDYEARLSRENLLKRCLSSDPDDGCDS